MPPSESPLCFIVMPFGKKLDANGTQVDFDAIYTNVIRPAVEAAGLTCIRGDEEPVGGLIHKSMFERLLLCDYAVADLSTANANVFYELGVRHAFRPFTTVLVYAEGFRLPFDVAPLRAMKYHLDPAGTVTQPEQDAAGLTQRLLDAQRDQGKDSPLFQIFDQLPEADLKHLLGADLAEEITEAERLRDSVAIATTLEEIDAVRDQVGAAVGSHPGVVVQLLSRYQALGGYPAMIALIESLPALQQRETFVRERYALALNRTGKRAKAKQVLTDLLDKRGPSSETLGLLGRVHKDEWEDALADHEPSRADGALKNAIARYREGFLTDPRDPYPGLNAVELMVIRGHHDTEWQRLLPVVRFSAERRVQAGGATYWDYATLLELALLDRDQEEVQEHLSAAMAAGPGPGEARSTLESLQRLAAIVYDEPRPQWVDDALTELSHAADRPIAR